MRRATENSGTKSLDFSANDPVGSLASELEPSPDDAMAGAMRRATGNSGTDSLDFAADDPAGWSASELEPSPDGAAAGAMRRATENSGTKSLDFSANDPVGSPASDLEPSPDDAMAGAMRRATENSGMKTVGIKRQLTYAGCYLSAGFTPINPALSVRISFCQCRNADSSRGMHTQFDYGQRGFYLPDWFNRTFPASLRCDGVRLSVCDNYKGLRFAN